MANIRLKELVEANIDPKLTARSKETGKLVYFKTPQAKDAAMKAGTHEDPKAKKGGEPKAAAKPNSMFGADYKKDRGAEAPKTPSKLSTMLSKGDSKLNNLLAKHGISIDSAKKANDEATKLAASISNGNTPEDINDGDGKDMANSIKDSKLNQDGTTKELTSKLQKSPYGKFVKDDKNDNMTFFFYDGSNYEMHIDRKNKSITTKKDRGGDTPKTSSKLSTMMPKVEPTPKIVGNWKSADEDGRMSSDAADDVRNYLNDVLGVDGMAEVDFGSGNIAYGLSDSENSIYVGRENGTYNVSYEGPSVDIDTINNSYKSFKNPKDALTYAGKLAQANRKGLEQKQDTGE